MRHLLRSQRTRIDDKVAWKLTFFNDEMGVVENVIVYENGKEIVLYNKNNRED